MTQKHYDDFDKKMEAVMKKNLGSVHASQDLINKTLLKINEEKNKPQQEQKESKKKPFIIPIAFVSGLAALLIALVGVSVMFFSMNKAKGSNKITTKDAGSRGVAPQVDGGEEKMRIESIDETNAEAEDSTYGNKVATLGLDDEESEDVDSVDNSYWDSGNSKAYAVMPGSYYTDDQVAVGQIAADRTIDYGSSFYNGYVSTNYVSPFDSLNNYYYSIQDKVWDPSISQGNIKDSVKNPDFMNQNDNKTNS